MGIIITLLLTIELVNTNHLTFIDALHNLTKQELEFRDERAKKINITVSSFPYVKTVDDFDFNYKPTVNKSLIYDLKSLRFMSEHKNIIFIGSPGTGKTHLAVSIGVEAASQRISTYFINFAVLMSKIKKQLQSSELIQL